MSVDNRVRTPGGVTLAPGAARFPGESLYLAPDAAALGSVFSIRLELS